MRVQHVRQVATLEHKLRGDPGLLNTSLVPLPRHKLIAPNFVDIRSLLYLSLLHEYGHVDQHLGDETGDGARREHLEHDQVVAETGVEIGAGAVAVQDFTPEIEVIHMHLTEREKELYQTAVKAHRTLQFPV